MRKVKNIQLQQKIKYTILIKKECNSAQALKHFNYKSGLSLSAEIICSTQI